MDRVRKISTELLQKFPDRFGIEFEENKKIVMELAKINSKQLRNQVAGFIASHLRKEAKSKEKLDSEGKKSQEIASAEDMP